MFAIVILSAWLVLADVRHAAFSVFAAVLSGGIGDAVVNCLLRVAHSIPAAPDRSACDPPYWICAMLRQRFARLASTRLHRKSGARRISRLPSTRSKAARRHFTSAMSRLWLPTEFALASWLWGHSCRRQRKPRACRAFKVTRYENLAAARRAESIPPHKSGKARIA
jgi:hypothetical protein